MTLEVLKAAGIPVAEGDTLAVLKAEAALDWMQEHTTLEFDKGSAESIAALPSCAKLFVVKYSEAMSLKQGVASQSIEGLSMSFNGNDQTAMVWQLANSLLGSYMKSQVRVFPAKRRW